MISIRNNRQVYRFIEICDVVSSEFSDLTLMKVKEQLFKYIYILKMKFSSLSYGILFPLQNYPFLSFLLIDDRVTRFIISIIMQ